jgi:hypothetical protein
MMTTMTASPVKIVSLDSLSFVIKKQIFLRGSVQLEITVLGLVRLEEKLTIFHVQIFVLCGKKNFGRLEAPTP